MLPVPMIIPDDDSPTPESLRALERIFFPYVGTRQRAAAENGARFAYYTTAATALRILQSRQVWLRDAMLMNDFSEVAHGLACVRAAFDGPAGGEFTAVLDKSFPGLAGEVLAQYETLRPNILLDTFITCVSEHLESEDRRGRLSMWRAYGGRTGVAIVFRGARMFRESDVIGATSSPVYYGDAEAFSGEFSATVENMKSRQAELAHLDRELVKGAAFQVLRYAAICTKHPGFKEELEWRIIASPSLHSPRGLQSSIEVINGVPQTVWKLNLQNDDSQGIVGMSLNELVDRIIIGPCEFPPATFRTFFEVLGELGFSDPASMIAVSDIPLRHNA